MLEDELREFPAHIVHRLLCSLGVERIQRGIGTHWGCSHVGFQRFAHLYSEFHLSLRSLHLSEVEGEENEQEFTSYWIPLICYDL